MPSRRDYERELDQAFVWDCPHCGQENFQRAVMAQLEGEDRKEIAVELGLIEEWEEPSASTDVSVITHPDVVYCRRCETRFDTVQGPLEEDDDEDDDL